jgi:hypothetical protein
MTEFSDREFNFTVIDSSDTLAINVTERENNKKNDNSLSGCIR